MTDTTAMGTHERTKGHVTRLRANLTSHVDMDGTTGRLTKRVFPLNLFVWLFCFSFSIFFEMKKERERERESGAGNGGGMRRRASGSGSSTRCQLCQGEAGPWTEAHSFLFSSRKRPNREADWAAQLHARARLDANISSIIRHILLLFSALILRADATLSFSFSNQLFRLAGWLFFFFFFS
ncbi:hypothetical protein IWZ03DRAFT_372234, partial [Phyllosticta citriasiana]